MVVVGEARDCLSQSQFSSAGNKKIGGGAHDSVLANPELPLLGTEVVGEHVTISANPDLPLLGTEVGGGGGEGRHVTLSQPIRHTDWAAGCLEVPGSHPQQ